MPLYQIHTHHLAHQHTENPPPPPNPFPPEQTTNNFLLEISSAWYCRDLRAVGALWCSGAYSRLVIRGSVVRVHPVHMPLDKAFYPQLSLLTQV